MSSELLDVVGIGNAIVDVVSHADDAFLTRHDLAKGAMTLIDAERAEAALKRAQERVEAASTDMDLELALASMRRSQARLTVSRRRRRDRPMSTGDRQG